MKMYILPLLIIIGIAIIFAFWHYVINIYEVKIVAAPEYLIPDGKSTTVVRAIPINAFGFKAPFRKSPAKFEIIEGKELINIISENDKEGVLEIQAKEKEGNVSIQLKSEFSLMPTIIEIPISDSISGIK